MLPSSLTQGRRVLLIGDIHGCFDELQAGAARGQQPHARGCWRAACAACPSCLPPSQPACHSQDLLALCGYQEGLDVVVSVGDLVNKGPDSLQVRRRE